MTWSVTLTASDATTATPDVISTSEGPVFSPTVSGLPTCTIPIPRDDTYQDSKWEDADMEVTVDGTEIPIDELKNVRTTATATILEGRGGEELTQRVTKEVGVKETHLVADDLITNNTTYTANVDTPTTTTDTNATVDTVSTSGEFEAALKEGGIPDTKPVTIDSGNNELVPQQSCFFQEAENANTNASTSSDSTWSNGSAVTLNRTRDYIWFDFTLDYTIPAGNVGIAIRYGRVGGLSDGHGWAVLVDGYEVDRTGSPTSTLGADAVFDQSFDTGGLELGPGTHGLRLDVYEQNSENVEIDAIAVYDTRFSYTFDNTTDANGYLSGPELYPDAVSLAFADAPGIGQAVTGGRVESTWDDTSNGQALAISNDRGESYLSASNTSTTEQDFADRDVTLRFKATLSRYGSRTTASPTTGFNAQSLQSYTLKADLEDMPMTVDDSFDGRLFEVLQELATVERGDFVWEVRRPTATSTSVEFTPSGQRTSADDPSVTGFDIDKATSRVVEKAIVRGGARDIPDERFVADHGTAVSLVHDNVIEGSITVSDPDADTRTVFEPGEDFVVDRQAGTITTQAGGEMTDGEEYRIAYRFKPVAEFTASGVSSPKTETFRIPQVATDRAAKQAARLIVADGQDPRYEGTITTPGTDTSFSVVETINPTAVPTAGTDHLINGVSAGTTTTVLDIASRRSIGEIVDRVEARVTTNADRV